MRTDRPRCRAFTLVELVVVVLIIGIVSALALPRMRLSLQHFETENAARRLARDIERAQQAARNQSRSITINLDPATTSYTIPLLDDPDRPETTVAVQLRSLYPHVSLSTADFNGTPLRFDGYGLPNKGGQIDLTVSSGARTRVLINANTGAVEVMR